MTGQPVRRLGGPRGQRREFPDPVHGTVQLGLAVERQGTLPGGPEIPMVGEPLGRLTERTGRPARVATVIAAQRAAQPGRGVGEGFLEPALERPPEKAPRFLFGGHLEGRVDPRLDRSLLEQIRAEPMDRPDVGEFQLGERPLQMTGGVAARRGPAAGDLDLGAQTELHLAGRLFREGDPHDGVERGATGSKNLDDPAHQGGGLPRAGRRLDEERLVEARQDRLALGGIRERGPGIRAGAHRISLNRWRSVGAGFRRARRSSSGPQSVR